MTDHIEAPSDVGPTPEAIATHWKDELSIAERVDSLWDKDAKRVLGIFQPSQKAGANKAEFNILFSNTQTLAPALYANTPRPDVRRRYHDPDPTGKEVAEVFERALSFSLDTYDFDAEMKSAVQDYLLVGRGVTRVKYEPKVKQVPTQIPVDVDVFGRPSAGGFPVDPEAIQQGDDGLFVVGEPDDVKESEEVSCETVVWDDFRVSPAKNWNQARWVAFRHRMTRDNLKENKFADVANIPLDVEDDTLGEDETKDAFKRAEVWEIWDKDKRQVLFINTGSTRPLRVDDDPLKLKGFFPMPKPIYSIKGSSLVPTPEYLVYEKLATELDEVTKRIGVITRAMKIRGVYDGTQDEIATILQQPDNTLVPSDNFALLLEKGGLANAVQFMPLEELARVLAQLYINRNEIKATIFEVTGVSDILRGQTNPTETATAQSIKAQFGSLRLEDRQKDVARFARDLMRIKAEIIGEHFSPESLSTMTGKEVSPEMTEIMSSDSMRAFRIDIETDSTIAVDQNAEQEAVTQLLTGLTEFLTSAVPLVQAQALSKETVKSLALMAVRRFRGSREVEDAINSIEGQDGEGEDPQAMVQQLQAKLQEMQAQGQEMQQALQEAQSGQAEAQKKLEIEQAAAQAKAQVAETVAQAKIDREDTLAQLEARIKAIESEAKIDREDFKAEAAARVQQQQANNQLNEARQ